MVAERCRLKYMANRLALFKRSAIHSQQFSFI
jgi:hypothetical protein